MEGFDKPGIFLVFNAGAKMKPEYPPAGGFEDFIFVTRQKTGKRTVLHSLPIRKPLKKPHRIAKRFRILKAIISYSYMNII
jgi:hypothetical protein